MSVVDWFMYMQNYILAVAVIGGRLTPALLTAYCMTMMELWSQLQRRAGIAFTKAFMVCFVNLFL